MKIALVNVGVGVGLTAIGFGIGYLVEKKYSEKKYSESLAAIKKETDELIASSKASVKTLEPVVESSETCEECCELVKADELESDSTEESTTES